MLVDKHREAYYASRTVHEVITYLEHGTPIPLHPRSSVHVAIIYLTTEQMNTLNSIDHTVAAQYLHYGWDGLAAAHRTLVLDYGEPTAMDDPSNWNIYTLIKLLDLYSAMIRCLGKQIDLMATRLLLR